MRLRILMVVLFAAISLGARAETLADFMSREEFESLAHEMSLKVNLFADVWQRDGRAEFFGGTSRDFLYWLKGQFRGARSRDDVDRIKASLLGRAGIDVRDFITGESDVDIMTDTRLGIDPAHYGVKKIDYSDKRRLDLSSDLGRTERDQGFIPVEKIRLSQRGLEKWEGLGDGTGEIYRGKITVTYAPKEVFVQTYYAHLGKNHPVLLALRYLRLIATNYYYEHGRGLPDEKALFDIDPGAARETRRILSEAVSDPNLRQMLKDPAFIEKANETIHKAFRTYTNPTAAMTLYRRFGADDVVGAHEKLEPINQYVFARARDLPAILQHLGEYRVDQDEFFRAPDELFPDGNLYHGTREEASFRAMLLVGVLPSVNGSAGRGLYGVSRPSLAFAEQWGRSKDRVVQFEVKPTARIVDITRAEGERVFREFTLRTGQDVEAFAEYFGIDILRYPYTERNAFVVKNSEALGPPRGRMRQIMTLGRFFEIAPTVTDEAKFTELVGSMRMNALTELERGAILSQVPYVQEIAQNTHTPSDAERLIHSLKLAGMGAKGILDQMEKIQVPVIRRRMGVLRAAFADQPPPDAYRQEAAVLQLFSLFDRLRAGDDPSGRCEAEAAGLWRHICFGIEAQTRLNPRPRRIDVARVEDTALAKAVLALLEKDNAEADAAILKDLQGFRRREGKLCVYTADFRFKEWIRKGIAYPFGLGLFAGMGADAYLHSVGLMFLGGLGGLALALSNYKGARERHRQERRAGLLDQLSETSDDYSLSPEQVDDLSRLIKRRARAVKRESAAAIRNAPARAPRHATLYEYLKEVNLSLRDFPTSFGLLEEAMTLVTDDGHAMDFIELADLLWDSLPKERRDSRHVSLERVITLAASKMPNVTNRAASVNSLFKHYWTLRPRTREIIIARAIRDIRAVNPQDLKNLEGVKPAEVECTPWYRKLFGG